KQYEGRRRPQDEALEEVLAFLQGLADLHHALVRGIDKSFAAAASVIIPPNTRFYQEHIAPRVEEASPAEKFIGNLLGTLGLVATDKELLGQVGRETMTIPQIARIASRVTRVSPFTAELARDLALGPPVEALRAALGHEVTEEDALRSTVTIG